jgi:hypothetical protein
MQVILIFPLTEVVMPLTHPAVVKTMLTPVIGTGTPNGSFLTGNLSVDVFGTYKSVNDF